MISMALALGFHGMELEKWIVLPEMVPTPRTASWPVTVSLLHVPAGMAAASVLSAELQHRVRNMLSVIRFIARRTAQSSDSIDTLAMNLEGRIDALLRHALHEGQPRLVAGLVRAGEVKVRSEGVESGAGSSLATRCSYGLSCRVSKTGFNEPTSYFCL